MRIYFYNFGHIDFLNLYPKQIALQSEEEANKNKQDKLRYPHRTHKDTYRIEVDTVSDFAKPISQEFIVIYYPFLITKSYSLSSYLWK